MKEWAYLDTMNYNLLYAYAEVLSGKKSRIEWTLLAEQRETREDLAEWERENEAEKAKETRRKNIWYLFYVVFRYVLGCETYEEALAYADYETLKKFRLSQYLQTKALFIGFGEYTFHFDTNLKCKEDIDIILDILYHRIVGIDQFACALTHIQHKKARHRKCTEMYELLLAHKFLQEGKVL